MSKNCNKKQHKFKAREGSKQLQGFEKRPSDLENVPLLRFECCEKASEPIFTSQDRVWYPVPVPNKIGYISPSFQI